MRENILLAKKNYVILLLILIGMINLFDSHWSPLTTLLSVYISSNILRKLGLNFIKSYFMNILFGVVIWTCFISMASIADWLLSLNASLAQLNFLGLLIAAFFNLISSSKSGEKLSKIPIITYQDFIGIAMVVTVLATLAIGAFRGYFNESGNIRTIAMRSISDSLDDSSHLTIMNDNLR